MEAERENEGTVMLSSGGRSVTMTDAEFEQLPGDMAGLASLESLVAACVDADRILRGAKALKKQANEALIDWMKLTRRVEVECPPYRIIYDYPKKRLWDVEELMAMTGGEDTDILFGTLFSKVTSGQLRALKERFEDNDDTIKQIIESAERVGQGHKRRLEITEVPLTFPETADVGPGGIRRGGGHTTSNEACEKQRR